MKNTYRHRLNLPLLEVLPYGKGIVKSIVEVRDCLVSN